MIKNAANKGIGLSSDSGETKVLTFSKVFGHEKKDIDRQKLKSEIEKKNKKDSPNGWTILE